MSTGPVEAKVKAGTFGAALAGVVVWALETYLFKGVVPAPVQALIDVAVPAVAAYACAYTAKHTRRDDPDAIAATGPQPGPRRT